MALNTFFFGIFYLVPLIAKSKQTFKIATENHKKDVNLARVSISFQYCTVPSCLLLLFQFCQRFKVKNVLRNERSENE